MKDYLGIWTETKGKMWKEAVVACHEGLSRHLDRSQGTKCGRKRSWPDMKDYLGIWTETKEHQQP